MKDREKLAKMIAYTSQGRDKFCVHITSPDSTYENILGWLLLLLLVTLGCLPFSFARFAAFVTYSQGIYNPCFEGIPKSACSLDVVRLHKNYITYLQYLFKKYKL